MERIATCKRTTKETDILVTINLDGTGKSEIDTGVGFFDHMLTLFARHGRMSLVVKADGDLWVDSHHTVEDVGIVLGQALKEALGDKAGINRYGTAFVPMDETLGMASLDLSGRSYLVFDASFDNRAYKIGFCFIPTAIVTATTVISEPIGIFPGPIAESIPETKNIIIGTR